MTFCTERQISRALLCAAVALLVAAIPSMRAGEDEVKDALKKKVSFEFKDMSLADALKFLTTQAKVPIHLDAKVTNAPAINLKVTDMELGTALEWVAKLAELEVVVGKTEIVISPPKK